MALHPDTSSLDDYLTYARKQGASDLHLGAEIPPMLRLHGHLTPISKDPLSPDQSLRLLFSTLSKKLLDAAQQARSLELCLSRDSGRYRMCAIKQRLGWDGCFHVIPSKVPNPRDMGLPESITKLTDHRNGLVLISGPRGSGKTTTLATLIEVVNRGRADHIITVEDPVEFRIPSRKSLVSQRTVGVHTESFANALRSALREDPDVIAVGDLRDNETTSMAVTAAETGHLVLACLNTGSAAGTISRIVDAFPPEQHSQVRTMLSESLRGVISQRLIPTKDGKGLALAHEVLIVTPGVGSLIREGRVFQLRSVMQTGRKHGMMALDDHLAELIRDGTISAEAAHSQAEDPGKLPKG